ncbi:hypothetical protein HID58_084802 [Brassica napus]|uniref:(rape) hypothetical protein n=1 Tax=Brassica napus TaxID=3708 RepID=A0A816IRP9_BRANA|nr:protein KOKOPELLI-like [Brassica napus]KAH0856541.1 hypothetical protein HID58_084802 [Brassica napus]CAF1716693.1 unnamed protein product [Brassica napus]
MQSRYCRTNGLFICKRLFFRYSNLTHLSSSSWLFLSWFFLNKFLMDPFNFETDLHSLRRLYGLLHSNTNNESIPQAFLLDENTQFLLKRLLDSETEELLARQTKILAQVQLGLPTPSKNSVSRGVIKLPSKVGLTEEVVDSIERIETQLSAFRFCSSRDDRTKTCKSRNIQEHSSSVIPFQRLSEKALMARRQSYQASVSGLRSTRTSNIAPRLRSVNNNAAACDDRALNLEPQGSSSPDDQVVVVRSRPPLPSRPKPRESNRTSLKMGSMKPTLLDQETETWDEESGGTRSGTSSQVSTTDQESEEASRETGSTTGSSWQTHGERVTESEDSSYQSSESDDNSQDSDSPPHKRRDRSKETLLPHKKSKGRLKRFKEKLGKVFHHHHYHHHHHESKEKSHKPSAWKHLVKKHLQKDKEKLVETRVKSESKGLVTKYKNKGGQFHALVEGLMRHRRRRSKMKKQSHGRKKMKWWQTRRRQGGVKFPKGRRVKLGKTNYLCNKDQENDEN